MKSLLKYSWIFLALWGTFAIVACSKGNNSAVGVTCPPGTYFDGSNCLNGTGPLGLGAGSRIGFYAQSNNFQGFANTGSTLNQGSGFRSLLKNAMGVCDRQTQIGGYNGGQAACAAWERGYHDIVVMLNGSTANQAKLVVRSYPYVDPYYSYTYTLPSLTQFFGAILGIYTTNPSGIFDPLVLDTTVWPINKSQGFELRANGPTNSYAWWKLIQLQVPTGKIEDPAINYTLYIDGGNQQMLPAASGTMVRCQTQDCGVQGL